MGLPWGETHERAVKTAETDATKRALATFGKPFGLALYLSSRTGRDQSQDQGVSNPLSGAPPIPETARRRTQQRVGPNGRYYVQPLKSEVLDPTVNGPGRERTRDGVLAGHVI